MEEAHGEQNAQHPTTEAGTAHSDPERVAQQQQHGPITGDPKLLARASLASLTPAQVAEVQEHCASIQQAQQGDYMQGIESVFDCQELLISAIGLEFQPAWLQQPRHFHWAMVARNKWVQLYQPGQSSDSKKEHRVVGLLTSKANLEIHVMENGLPAIFTGNAFVDGKRAGNTITGLSLEKAQCTFEELQAHLRDQPDATADRVIPWPEVVGTPSRLLGVAVLHPLPETLVGHAVKALALARSIAHVINVPVVIFDQRHGCFIEPTAFAEWCRTAGTAPPYVAPAMHGGDGD